MRLDLLVAPIPKFLRGMTVATPFGTIASNVDFGSYAPTVSILD